MCKRNCEMCHIKIRCKYGDKVYADYTVGCSEKYTDRLAELNNLLASIASKAKIGTVMSITVSGDCCDDGAKTWSDDVTWSRAVVEILVLERVTVKDVRSMRNEHMNTITLQNCVVLDGRGDCMLDFSEGFPMLYEIHLNGMGLTDLSRQVRFSDGVVTLGFFGNHIRDGHGVVWPKGLHAIFMGYNHIESVASFVFPRFMKILDFTGNKLTGFDGWEAPRFIQAFYAPGNLIEHLDLKSFCNLSMRHIDVSRNKITTVTGFMSAKNLCTLVLDGNLFTELPVMYCDVAHSNCVPVIKFDGCPLSQLGKERARIFAKYFDPLEINTWCMVRMRCIAIVLVYEIGSVSSTIAARKMPIELIRVMMTQYLKP